MEYARPELASDLLRKHLWVCVLSLIKLFLNGLYLFTPFSHSSSHFSFHYTSHHPTAHSIQPLIISLISIVYLSSSHSFLFYHWLPYSYLIQMYFAILLTTFNHSTIHSQAILPLANSLHILSPSSPVKTTHPHHQHRSSVARDQTTMGWGG